MHFTFATRGTDGRTNYWTPERPKEYGAACAMGRDYAAELITHIQEQGDPSVFGAVIQAMMNGGIYEGVEAGFCSVVGIQLMNAGAAKQPRDTVEGPTPDLVDGVKTASPASR